MTRRVQVLVVGGGVIGAAVADALSRDGADVLVVDRGRPGHGCSYGNAGWVTPSFAMPLPRPGLFWKALGWMADPESPLYIRPRADVALARWLLGFAGAMKEDRFRRGTRALVELSRFSIAAYDELDGADPGRFGMQRRGLLVLGQTPAGAKGAHEELDLLATLDIRGQALDSDGVRALEPAVVGPVSGGVYYPDEAHVEPLPAVEALLGRARAAGARLCPGTEMIDVRIRDGRIHAVRTTRGWIEAENVVLATGAWSARIGKALGLRIPVLGGKGYSMVLDAPERQPRIPMMLVEKKIAVTPHEHTLRLAGTLELVDEDLSVSTRRIDAIHRGASTVLDLPAEPRIHEIWRGLRPCTPDGLPVIGRPPGVENLVIATGHQMLGLQTAPATGRLVADMVLRRTPAFDPTPFRPERF